MSEHKENVCPVCGSNLLDYDPAEIDGMTIGYPWKCFSCNSTGEEVYSLTFVEHTNLVKGSK